MGNRKSPCCSPIICASEKVVVWEVISSKGLIGPFFRSEVISAPRNLDILHIFVVVENALEDTVNTS